MNSTTTASNPERLGTPPPYEPAATEASKVNESGANPSSQIFEENQYGEMRPAEQSANVDAASLQPAQSAPSNTIYVENQYGEMHREETDPDLQQQRQPESGLTGFGQDTDQRAEEFQSNQTYPENRYGELGRADTYVNDHAPLSDKLKGTAEQIIGKLTSNRELHDKGVARKSASPVSLSA